MYNMILERQKNLDPYKILNNIIPKFDIFNCYFNRYRVDLSTSNLSMYYRSCYLDIHYTNHVNRYRVDLSISNISMYYRSCYLDIHYTYHVNRYRVDLSTSKLMQYIQEILLYKNFLRLTEIFI